MGKDRLICAFYIPSHLRLTSLKLLPFTISLRQDRHNDNADFDL